MPEPVSWQILEYLKGRIEGITIANGFHTDLGTGSVAVDREQMPETEGPATIILGLGFETLPDASSRKTLVSDMDIVIEFQLPYASTENPMRVAHRGRHDLVRVLGADLFNQPSGFRSLAVTGSSITPPEGGATTVVAQVTARAGLSEPLLPA